MIKEALAVLCLAVAVSAYPAYPWGYYWNNPYYYNYYSPYVGGYWDPYYYRHTGHQATPQGKLIFYGQFHGSCIGAPDGLYYIDERSFAYCSNEQKTIQPCAEGSANPSLNHFKSGHYYGLLDFCSINLVAQGYAPHAPTHAPSVYPPKAPTHAPTLGYANEH